MPTFSVLSQKVSFEQRNICLHNTLGDQENFTISQFIENFPFVRIITRDECDYMHIYIYTHVFFISLVLTLN